MSTSISLAYPEIHPGVAISFTPGWWTTIAEIFRRILSLVHNPSFQVGAEAVAVLSVFAAVVVWVFALSSGKVTNPQIFQGS